MHIQPCSVAYDPTYVHIFDAIVSPAIIEAEIGQTISFTCTIKPKLDEEATGVTVAYKWSRVDKGAISSSVATAGLNSKTITIVSVIFFMFNLITNLWDRCSTVI